MLSTSVPSKSKMTAANGRRAEGAMKRTGRSQRHVIGTQRDGSKDGIPQQVAVVSTLGKSKEGGGLESEI